jgi:aminomethyltransferase
MGYVDTAHSAVGTRVSLIVRGTAMPAEITAMPFVPNRFYRG